MNGALILLLILATPYVVYNVYRLVGGRRWAFGVCTIAKEWEQREHARRMAQRSAGPS